MRILVSGSSGLIGSALVSEIESSGGVVQRLVRSTPVREGDVFWDPSSGRFDLAAAEGAEGVVHLAGESIASGRWSPERKEAIRASRIRGTRVLAEGFAALARPPKVMVCASAVGFYGSSGEATVDETLPAGAGFLAETCQAWEAAADPARKKGIRVVHLRFGLVLSPRGGALARMLPAFRLGLGGRLGSGNQWMSWIAIDDVTSIIRYALLAESLRGPVNVVSPQPVRNRDFTRALASLLRRPALFPVPAFALRLAFGEMADEALLASTRAVPAVLIREGYRFSYAELEPALRHLLETER